MKENQCFVRKLMGKKYLCAVIKLNIVVILILYVVVISPEMVVYRKQKNARIVLVPHLMMTLISKHV